MWWRSLPAGAKSTPCKLRWKPLRGGSRPLLACWAASVLAAHSVHGNQRREAHGDFSRPHQAIHVCGHVSTHKLRLTSDEECCTLGEWGEQRGCSFARLLSLRRPTCASFRVAALLPCAGCTGLPRPATSRWVVWVGRGVCLLNHRAAQGLLEAPAVTVSPCPVGGVLQSPDTEQLRGCPFTCSAQPASTELCFQQTCLVPHRPRLHPFPAPLPYLALPLPHPAVQHHHPCRPGGLVGELGKQRYTWMHHLCMSRLHGLQLVQLVQLVHGHQACSL